MARQWQVDDRCWAVTGVVDVQECTLTVLAGDFMVCATEQGHVITGHVSQLYETCSAATDGAALRLRMRAVHFERVAEAMRIVEQEEGR